MKTVTILIFTLFLSPWTMHANGEAKETSAIESLNFIQPETIDRQAFQQTAVQPDTTNKQELLERVRERDYISVIITYKMDRFANERNLNENQSRAQRSQIAQMHNDFVRELDNVDFTYQIGRKLNLRPRISITVDKKGLKYLYDLQFIERIIENKSVPRHLAR